MIRSLRITLALAGQVALAAAITPALGQADFADAVYHNAGDTPSAVVLGDLIGDFSDDIAVVNYDGHLQVLFNNGAGNFLDPVSYDGLWDWSVALVPWGSRKSIFIGP